MEWDLCLQWYEEHQGELGDLIGKHVAITPTGVIASGDGYAEVAKKLDEMGIGRDENVVIMRVHDPNVIVIPSLW